MKIPPATLGGLRGMVFCLFVTPSSQEMESPANPGRFNCQIQLREVGCQVIGTTGDADKSIYDVDVILVLVKCSEEEGMRQDTRNHCDQLVKISMFSSVESLNLSVATGVCLYELQRRAVENDIRTKMSDSMKRLSGF